MRSYGVALLVLLATFLLNACGSAGPPPQAPRSTDQPVIGGAPAGFNTDDVAFANHVITSFGQTSELAAQVPQRATDPNLIALSSAITAAQAPDLQAMKVFLVQWDSNSTPGGPGGSVVGMVDDATMARLNSLSGKEFDGLWLRSMIGHQRGVVQMATAEIAHGTNVDAVATARQLVGTYGAQITRMQHVLADG